MTNVEQVEQLVEEFQKVVVALWKLTPAVIEGCVLLEANKDGPLPENVRQYLSGWARLNLDMVPRAAGRLGEFVGVAERELERVAAEKAQPSD